MEPGAWYESARVPAEPAVHAIIAAPGCTIIPIDALTSVKQKKQKMIGLTVSTISGFRGKDRIKQPVPGILRNTP